MPISTPLFLAVGVLAPMPTMLSASQTEAGGREVSAEANCQRSTLENSSFLGELLLTDQPVWYFNSYAGLMLSEMLYSFYLLFLAFYIQFLAHVSTSHELCNQKNLIYLQLQIW